MTNEYFYGSQSEIFSFFRIPKELITGKAYKHLSSNAKLLYGLLLDRMGLSTRNGWYDEQNRVYIYYTVEDVAENLCCGLNKAAKLLAELDSDKGIGLIERVKQGQGKPMRIYVKAFTSVTPPSPKNDSDSGTPDSGSADCSKAKVQTSENRISRPLKTGSQDLSKVNANNNDTIYTEKNYTDPSIHLWEQTDVDGMSGDQNEVSRQAWHSYYNKWIETRFAVRRIFCRLLFIWDLLLRRTGPPLVDLSLQVCHLLNKRPT